jgi:hypothetical protein
MSDNRMGTLLETTDQPTSCWVVENSPSPALTFIYWLTYCVLLIINKVIRHNQSLLNNKPTLPRSSSLLGAEPVTSESGTLHAVLTKLQSLENSKEQCRTTRRYFEHQDQTRRTPRGQPIDSAGNRKQNDSVQVRHVRRDNRDRNPRSNPLRGPRTNRSRRSFFGGQGRLNDDIEPRLNAAAQDFVPCSTTRRDDSRSPNMTYDGARTGDLNA